MKKMLVVLLILAMAMGAFAQEIKFSGDISSGLESTYQVITDKDEDDAKYKDEDFKAYSYDADDGSPVRARLNVDATYENIAAHIQFKLHEPSNVYAALGYAYGSVTLINIIDIYGGIVDNGAWTTMGDKDGDVGEGTGGLVQVRPIEGLNIGFGVYTAAPNDRFIEQKFTVGAAYKNDIFGVAASFALKNKDPDALFTGIKLTFIDPLFIGVELWSETLAKDTIAWTIDEKITFKVTDAFNVGLTAWQFLNQVNGPGYIESYYKIAVGDVIDPLSPNYDETFPATYSGANENAKFGWKFNPWASFAIGNIVPKLSFIIGGTGVDDGDASTTVLYMEIKPSVTFNITDKASIALGYAFDYASMKAEEGDGVSINRNVISLDWRWKF